MGRGGQSSCPIEAKGLTSRAPDREVGDKTHTDPPPRTRHAHSEHAFGSASLPTSPQSRSISVWCSRDVLTMGEASQDLKLWAMVTFDHLPRVTDTASSITRGSPPGPEGLRIRASHGGGGGNPRRRLPGGPGARGTLALAEEGMVFRSGGGSIHASHDAGRTASTPARVVLRRVAGGGLHVPATGTRNHAPLQASTESLLLHPPPALLYPAPLVTTTPAAHRRKKRTPRRYPTRRQTLSKRNFHLSPESPPEATSSTVVPSVWGWGGPKRPSRQRAGDAGQHSCFSMGARVQRVLLHMVAPVATVDSSRRREQRDFNDRSDFVEY